MREILFRAKAINRDSIDGRCRRTDYKNGDWVYGLVTKLHDEKYGFPAEMEYSTERGGFLPFAHGDGCGCCETATLNDSTCHTVIGNIYDNPELLKE